MAPITAKITVAKPLAEVWAYVADVTRNPEWQTWISEIDVVGGGPLALGTQVHQVAEIGSGRSIELTWEVTELEAGSHYRFETKEQGMVMPSGGMVVAPAPDGSDGTEVTFELAVNPQGSAKLFAGMIDQQIQRRAPLDLARLKEKLEA